MGGKKKKFKQQHPDKLEDCIMDAVAEDYAKAMEAEFLAPAPVFKHLSQISTKPGKESITFSINDSFLLNEGQHTVAEYYSGAGNPPDDWKHYVQFENDPPTITEDF
jgi:hypothetical protein